MTDPIVEEPVPVPVPPPVSKHICEICGAQFVKYATYYSHVKTKHKDPDVRCAHCSTLFATYALRNSHFYRAMHAKDEDAIVESTRKQRRKPRKVQEEETAEESPPTPPRPVKNRKPVVESETEEEQKPRKLKRSLMRRQWDSDDEQKEPLAKILPFDCRPALKQSSFKRNSFVQFD